MSGFYCVYHDRLECDDEVGYNIHEDSGGNEIEVCDDALYDIHFEEELFDVYDSEL